MTFIIRLVPLILNHFQSWSPSQLSPGDRQENTLVRSHTPESASDQSHAQILGERATGGNSFGYINKIVLKKINNTGIKKREKQNV